MRMRKSSSRPEDAIQRAVFQHEKARKAPGTFMFHVPNGGKRKPIEAAIMKGLGVDHWARALMSRGVRKRRVIRPWKTCRRGPQNLP